MRRSRNLRLLLATVVLLALLGGCATAVTDEQADQDFAAKKYQKAAAEYHRLAQGGDAHAEMMEAYIYVYSAYATAHGFIPAGYGAGRVNMSRPETWFKQAADQGSVDSAAALGNLYQWYDTDYAEASKWDLQAAQAGNGLAEANLATLYERGLGVTQDQASAREWQLKADQQSWGDVTEFEGVTDAAISDHIRNDKQAKPLGALLVAMADQTRPSKALGVARVGFDYSGGGRAENVRLEQSSGKKDVDAFALETVSDSLLPPLPPAVKATTTHFVIQVAQIQPAAGDDSPIPPG